MTPHRLPPLSLAALPLLLTGCLVLPFGVHVNRPFPTGETGRIRGGVGFAGLPEGQGAVDAVPTSWGTPVNPIPPDQGKGRLVSAMLHLAIGLHPSLDLGWDDRGGFLLWEPFRAGSWSMSLTPAIGRTRASEKNHLPAGATRDEEGQLVNANVTLLGVWRAHPDDRATGFLYAGGAYNRFRTKISVTETAPAYEATGTGNGHAPDALVGAGIGFGPLQLNLEGGATFITQRDGRKDVVPTASMLVTVSGNPFR